MAVSGLVVILDGGSDHVGSSPMRDQERFKIIFLKGTWELSCQEYLSHTRITHGQAQTSEIVRP